VADISFGSFGERFHLKLKCVKNKNFPGFSAESRYGPFILAFLVHNGIVPL
jgi:hypothetical protein